MHLSGKCFSYNARSDLEENNFVDDDKMFQNRHVTKMAFKTLMFLVLFYIKESIFGSFFDNLLVIQDKVDVQNVSKNKVPVIFTQYLLPLYSCL